MHYLTNYLNGKNKEIKNTVKEVTNDILNKNLKKFDFKSTVNGLLFGEVQSGKTIQIFGIISAAADTTNFCFFIMLTSDNTKLHEQTYRRALEELPEFSICSEYDTIRFEESIKQNKPILIILKKNINILGKWLNNIKNSKFIEDKPLFIIDDEADAASLNTKVNNKKNEKSKINKNLENIKQTAPSCVYLQVTATPQALVLQSIYSSDFKPSFVSCFKPGKNYIGGDFFFSHPKPYTVRFIDNSELKNNVEDSNEIITPDLATSLLNFIVSVSETKIENLSSVCNMIIHPSHKTEDHNFVRKKIEEFLNEISADPDDNCLKEKIKSEWKDLKKSRPKINDFDIILETFFEVLQEIKIIVLNSKSQDDKNYDNGYNIIIGGNTLGRGVTFNNLLTIFYSRHTKIPQADTFWQHCRMFGYDRDKSLIRIFIPKFIYDIFKDLNEGQKVLVSQFEKNVVNNTNLIYLDGIKPTRKNVVDTKRLLLIYGGTSYFPDNPKNINFSKLESILEEYKDKEYYECHIDTIIKILSYINNDSDKWKSEDFIKALNDLNNKKINGSILIVRTDREITKGTGTMISENDRKLVKSFRNKKKIVLVMYKIKGIEKLGWGGKTFWMPNITFPKGYTICKTID